MKLAEGYVTINHNVEYIALTTFSLVVNIQCFWTMYYFYHSGFYHYVLVNFLKFWQSKQAKKIFWPESRHLPQIKSRLFMSVTLIKYSTPFSYTSIPFHFFFSL